jgi:TATA-binding protein-associated factor Taf7
MNEMLSKTRKCNSISSSAQSVSNPVLDTSDLRAMTVSGCAASWGNIKTDPLDALSGVELSKLRTDPFTARAKIVQSAGLTPSDTFI